MCTPVFLSSSFFLFPFSLCVCVCVCVCVGLSLYIYSCIDRRDNASYANASSSSLCLSHTQRHICFYWFSMTTCTNGRLAYSDSRATSNVFSGYTIRCSLRFVGFLFTIFTVHIEADWFSRDIFRSRSQRVLIIVEYCLCAGFLYRIVSHMSSTPAAAAAAAAAAASAWACMCIHVWHEATPAAAAAAAAAGASDDHHVREDDEWLRETSGEADTRHRDRERDTET